MEKRNAQIRMPSAMPEKFSWLAALLADKKLTTGAKNVATRLMLHHNDRTGQCNPTHTRLAAGLGLSEKHGRKTVCKLIGELKAGGWIEATDTDGASEYRLVIARAAAVAMVPADDPDAADRGQGVSLTDDRGVSPTGDKGVADWRQGVSLTGDTEPLREPSREPSISPAPTAGAAGSGTRKDEAFGRMEPKPVRSRFTEMPEAWQPDETLRTLAIRTGVRASDLAGAASAFVLHHRGKGTRSPDWSAQWEMWCRKHVEIRTDREARGTTVMPDSARSRTARSRFQIAVPRQPVPAEAA